MEKTGDKGVPAKELKAKKNKFKPKRKITEKEAAEKRTYMDDFSGKFK